MRISHGARGVLIIVGSAHSLVSNELLLDSVVLLAVRYPRMGAWRVENSLGLMGRRGAFVRVQEG
jgi:hypothetical protein